MATIKAYTDIKQSKKLTEILPIESADHHYVRKVVHTIKSKDYEVTRQLSKLRWTYG